VLCTPSPTPTARSWRCRWWSRGPRRWGRTRRINRSTYRVKPSYLSSESVKPFYLSSETVLPIKRNRSTFQVKPFYLSNRSTFQTQRVPLLPGRLRRRARRLLPPPQAPGVSNTQACTLERRFFFPLLVLFFNDLLYDMSYGYGYAGTSS
jgi:hypothetical protein